MRRSTLPLLRCPRCLSGSLTAEGEAPVLEFGPMRCSSCAAVFPLAEGVLDLLADGGESERRSLAQRVMETRAIARIYERGLRSAFVSLAARAKVDIESEHLVVSSMLGDRRDGPLLDLSCGTCVHARRLAPDWAGPVLGLDVSLAMLDEALHHLREVGAAVDLVRGHATRLPLVDGAVQAVLNVGAFHLYPDAAAVLGEVARVLAPGGRFVCGTLLPEPLDAVNRLEGRAGIHRRGEAALRALCAAAGFEKFERLLLWPLVWLRAEKPAGAGIPVKGAPV